MKGKSEGKWVPATYRPARVVVPYAFGEPMGWEPYDAFRRMCWARSGAPSAMGTEPVLMQFAAQERLYQPLGSDLDSPSVYVPETNEMRAPAGEEAWSRASREAGFRYRFTGPAVTYLARPGHGFVRPDGRAVTDVRAEFKGMLRLDERGLPVIEADVPLCIQYLAMTRAMPGSALGPDGPAHRLHVRVLGEALSGPARLTPGAWIDLDRLDELAGLFPEEGYPSGAPHDLDTETVLLSEEAARWTSDRPATRLGPGLGISPRLWGRRDTPGWGRTWTALDLALGSLPGSGTPPASADLACLPPSVYGATIERVKAYLADQEPVAAAGERSLHRDGPLRVWAWEADGLFHLAAARDGVPEPDARDPLMTEGMVPPEYLAVLDEAPATAGEALARLDLDHLLVRVDGFPDYPGLALLTAHEEGVSVADLCAAYAEAIAWPLGERDLMWRIHEFQVPRPSPKGAVAAGNGESLGILARSAAARMDRENASCVASLTSLGGTSCPRLKALLRDHNDYAFGDADVRAAEILVEAALAGASLEDMAAEWLRRHHAGLRARRPAVTRAA